MADRSNNRIQIFDKDMNFVDEWRQFGRPSGVVILKDDTLVVADSESSYTGFRPAECRMAAGHQSWQREGWLAPVLHFGDKARRDECR